LSETFDKTVVVDFVVDCRLDLKSFADVESFVDTDN